MLLAEECKDIVYRGVVAVPYIRIVYIRTRI